MKIPIRLIPIIFLIFIYGCATNDMVTQASMEMSPSYKEELQLSIQHLIAKEYLSYLDKNNVTLAIGHFGWAEVRKCWEEIPEVAKYRVDFDKADEDFVDFICSKDERMTIAIEKWNSRTLEKGEWGRTKSVVYGSVKSKYPEEYKIQVENREEKLRVCNYKTLEYLIEDYNQKGCLFPIDWIPSYHMKQILNEDFLHKINAEFDGVGIEVLEMNNN